ncbi:MAG: TlpA disulfide reductase family protein [Acidobacteriota bacterium]|nr:TlpA disulfide reductase family protein [Acidobacteriota bacterium]
MNKFGLVVLVAVLCVFVGCPKDETQLPEESLTPAETVLVAVGDTAPGFELVTLEGEIFNLEAQRGKVVLINFFATWCPPCREELPFLENEIWRRFDPDLFALIVVGREEDDEVIGPFVESNGYSLPFAGDPDRVAYDQYASRFIPRNFVIGPDGMVFFQSQGFEREDFDRMIAVIEDAVAALDEPAEADAA